MEVGSFGLEPMTTSTFWSLFSPNTLIIMTPVSTEPFGVSTLIGSSTNAGAGDPPPPPPPPAGGVPVAVCAGSSQ